MSHSLQQPRDDILGLDTGLEALQNSSEFDGLVEPVAEHESYDHLAFIYESQAEQFATAIPYIEHGLERGERCIYIADENDTTEVLTALEESGVDVDDALESGSLVMYTAQEAYLRNGQFDPDEMIAFIAGAIEEGTEEFEGVRITGEMTWVFGDDPPLEELIEYEGKLNELLPDANGIALCQYNREKFSAEIIRDVIRTHPHLIYSNTVCQNFYYTPPEEFFGHDQPEREIDRMMGTLLDRTTARVELRNHQQHLERQIEIAADAGQSFDEKLRNLFELGRNRFDLELGGLAKVDPAHDTLEVEAVSGEHDHLESGTEVPLSETCCRLTVATEETADVTDLEDSGFAGTLAYETFGVEAYLGTRIRLENGTDRTFFFVSTEPGDREFSDADRTFHHLMGQWLKYELEQRNHERQLKESNERLEQFAYAASHDLQEPLRMVTSYLQLLENRHGESFDGDGQEFLEFAVDGAERMREMINALLEYSRVETQGDPFEPVELDQILGNVLNDLQIQIEESDATIRTEQLPRAEGDANQLRQVLQNLIVNAITYSGDAPPEVHVDAERQGRNWVLSVHDDGIGIDPEDQDRVFSVFDRLHSREEYEGTGIGLALCQRIVERHGGEIWVESDPGEGSTFSFTLPAADVHER
ncbi:MEDS domain-containing protein [Natrarchaeobius chitinivorans]|uniref:histidine kinase n=1 Tax=Natrarchaeobius chitinivorans TaxID=1679083 RepID=A0A3N6MFI0_NATCH|nr:MEDS domain-containing protein [Natrarchaeobius chitinivorans]RQG94331.1 histidine kinase [Natrarchaeobius chitinivorans]